MIEYQWNWIDECMEVTMPMEAAQIEVKKERGRLIVKAIGRGPRGQKYTKARKELAVKSMSDLNFKAQMEAAVYELLGSEA